MKIPDVQQIMAFKIDENQLKQNKKQMMSILKNAPLVGAYKNEDEKQWNSFFKFYIDFLASEIGPRGQCAKRIRTELLKDKQHVDQILFKLFNDKKLTVESHIRDIFVKFKNFTPCAQFIEIQKLNDGILKIKQNLSKLSNPESQLCKNIMRGMLDKKNNPKKKSLKNNNREHQLLNMDLVEQVNEEDRQKHDSNQKRLKIQSNIKDVKQQQVKFTLKSQPQKPFELIFLHKITECIENYTKKLQISQNQKTQKAQIMNKNQVYHDYMAVKTYMQIFF